jgi:hypothetical protein
VAVDPLIFVAQDVADTGNIFPAHLLVLRLQLSAEMTAGLGNHLDAALQR